MFSLIALYFASRQPALAFANQVTPPVKTAANDTAATPATRAA